MKTINGKEMVEMTAWIDRQTRDEFKRRYPQGAFSYFVRKMLEKKLAMVQGGGIYEEREQG